MRQRVLPRQERQAIEATQHPVDAVGGRQRLCAEGNGLAIGRQREIDQIRPLTGLH